MPNRCHQRYFKASRDIFIACIPKYKRWLIRPNCRSKYILGSSSNLQGLAEGHWKQCITLVSTNIFRKTREVCLSISSWKVSNQLICLSFKRVLFAIFCTCNYARQFNCWDKEKCMRVLRLTIAERKCCMVVVRWSWVVWCCRQSRSASRLCGARVKKQFWRPTGANVLFCRNYLPHCWDLSAPPVIWHLGNCAIPPYGPAPATKSQKFLRWSERSIATFASLKEFWALPNIFAWSMSVTALR